MLPGEIHLHHQKSILMKEKVVSTLTISECLAIPRFNYRTITKAHQAELKAFSERLISEGQLTPIRIAELSKVALKKEPFSQLCREGNHILIDGERRLLAMQLAHEKNPELFQSITVEFKAVNSLKQYLSLQMTYNMDRKNTSFTEDGLGFKRYIENGGKKTELLKTINFPEGVLVKKDKLKYITERIELIELHTSLHPFLDNGLIRSFKSKPHQGYLIKDFSEVHQIALAKEYEEVPNPKTDKDILGFINRFRTEFKNVPFDSEDEGLGIEKFGTKSCTKCPHLRTLTEENWQGETEEKTYCYLVECFKTKRELQSSRLMEKLLEEKVPFVILGLQSKEYSSAPSEEELENGLTKIRYYKIVKEGSCSNALAAISDGDYEARGIAQGVVHYICPEKSKCPVHHPQKLIEKTEKRQTRLSSEMNKVEKGVHISTAIEWSKMLLSGDYSNVLEELTESYFLESFERFFRAMDSETQKTFMNIIGSSDKKSFSAWSSEKVKKGFDEFGMEQSWIGLLLAFYIHDFGKHWERFKGLGEKTEIDFRGMLEKNLEISLGELGEKHQKRKAGWDKEQELLSKKIHALYFDLPLFLGIFDWTDEAGVLEILKEEQKGKKACRLIGVKLEREGEYIPDQIFQKLKGKKAELDSIFPDYELPEIEALLLSKHQEIPNQAHSEITSDELKFGVGIQYNFVRQCIEKASNLNLDIALAEFLTASVINEKVTLPIFHKDSLSIAQKVIKEESLSGHYELDKASKTFSFLNTELEETTSKEK